MNYLRYLGDPALGQWIGGHPAADHAEPDDEIAAERIATGLYEACDPFPEPEAPVAAEPEPEPEPAPRPLDWWRTTTGVALDEVMTEAAQDDAKPASSAETSEYATETIEAPPEPSQDVIEALPEPIATANEQEATEEPR